jgi:hypothetical protein
MTKLLVLFGVLFMVFQPASGQVPDDPKSSAEAVGVRVTTNLPDALLYADTTFVGRVPSGVISIPAETKRIRLVHLDANTWTIPPAEKVLDADAGDTVEVELNFDYHYQIESVPFGARVLLEEGQERTLLGSTPLLHTSDSPLDGRLAVEQPGYAIERIEPGREVWNRHVVTLNPSELQHPSAAQVDWKPPRKHRRWVDYAALGTAIAAGAFAIHYKFKADNLFSEYEDTADPSLRPEISAYDTRSGIAFGVMQAGIGIFAIRLLIR